MGADQMIDREPKITRRRLLAGIGGLALGLTIDQLTHQSQPAKAKSSRSPTPTAAKEASPSIPPNPSVKPSKTPIPPMIPSSEKTFPGGITEKYDMATQENFDQHFERVTPEQFVELLKTQPDLTAFPFNPVGNFQMGELTRIEGTKFIVVYCPNVEVYSSVPGTLILYKNKDGSIIPSIFIRGTPQTGSVEYTAGGEKAVIQTSQVAGTVSKGAHLFDFLGSGPINNDKYSAKPNELMAGISYGVSLTPSLNEWQKWVHTDDGKIAVISSVK